MTQDRIPPRVDTPVAVTVNGWTPPMLDAEISVAGSGGGNGNATVDGGAVASLNASATVQLRGTVQTSPGKAGNLHLVARHGGTEIARSPGFSVASVLQNVVVSFNSLVTGARRGFAVDTTFSSDSGVIGDLDEVEFSEQVQYDAGTGSLAGGGAGMQNSGYLPATAGPFVDTHSRAVSTLTGPGTLTAEQTFIFKDARTGANDIPARGSGFRISRVVTEATPGSIFITTSKVGVATTANGFASTAGSGSVSRTQAV